jgi:hypothetical protein
MPKKGLLFLLFLVFAVRFASAAGHGPLFGFSTATNFRNSFTIDFGVMNRRGAVSTDTSARLLLSYGVTENLTVSASVPYLFKGVQLVPGRQAGAMPGTSDFESYVSYRFHKQNLGVAKRIESTLYGGVSMPGPQQEHDFFGDHKETFGYWAGASTGYSSRIYYVWLGFTYSHYIKSEAGDQRPDSYFYSAVYGIRPPFGRKEYPHWDWRIFAELTGEITDPLNHHGFIVSNSGGNSVFLGPSILGLYRNYAVQAGVQFPVYKDVGDYYEEELARFAFNFSYLF